MQSPLLSLLGIAFAAIFLWLAWQTPRQSRIRKAARAGYFDQVAALFTDVTRRTQPTGFARISGRFGGLSYDLQAVPDTLTFRKLPALWVLLTQTEPLPLRATLDVMARPTLHETFSNFGTLQDALPLPTGFPPDSSVRSDHARLAPPQDLLTRHSFLFTNPTTKELVLSPKGMRIVFLAEEADRGRYLLFREAEMGRTPLQADRLRPLLAALQALRTDVLETCANEATND